MRTHTSGRGFAGSFNGRLSQFERLALRLHEETARATEQDMREQTAGTISSAELRRRGHPFGRGRGRRPRVPTPKLPINRQSGAVQAGISLGRGGGRGVQSFSLSSSARHASYVFHPLGTRKMVGRGLLTGNQIGLSTPGYLERQFRRRNPGIMAKLRRVMR